MTDLANASHVTYPPHTRDPTVNTLTLIPFTSNHFAALQSWFADERSLAQWGGSGLDFPLSEQAMQGMLAEGKTDPPGRLCRMAIDDRGALVGHVQIALDWVDGVGRLSRVAIAPDRRGKGHANALLTLALVELFSHEEMQRAELNVYTWNDVAIRTYEKLGFVREGVRRSCTKVGTERWDTAIMGLLRSEWEQRLDPHA